jgi:AcrR family transcriptional regulator
MLPSRRDRKRAATRDALRDAAFELFEQHGFEAVTVADIAERADVAASTFFRHFTSKEAVLFAYQDDRSQALLHAIAARPASEPTLDVIRAVMSTVEPDAAGQRLRMRLAETSPDVRAEILMREAQLADDLAEAIARHLGVDPKVDPVPYLTARAWLAAAAWFGRSKARTTKGRISRSEGAAAVDEVLRSLGPVIAGAR